MQDIHSHQLTEKLIHLEDKKVKNIKSNWFRSTAAENVSVEMVIKNPRNGFYKVIETRLNI